MIEQRADRVVSRTRIRTEVLIVGSGFGGCLTALVLNRLGYDCCVLDRQRHPRFAIGESSTPIADTTLEYLADRYDLGAVRRLAKYSTACQMGSGVTVGCKRGFSYFSHVAQQPFHTGPVQENQLLVAASANDQVADTNWYRPSVDCFFVDQIMQVGIPLLEEVEVANCELKSSGCVVNAKSLASGQSLRVAADFVIDASGAAGVIAGNAGLQIETDCFRTTSSATFGHFRDVIRFGDVLKSLEINQAAHPFDCDMAALHHVLDEGWMWQLRFDNGITSLGFVDDNRSATGPRQAMSTAEERRSYWQGRCGRYPSLGAQLTSASLVAPDSLRHIKRLQYLRRDAAGPRWIGLPNVIGFVDPLHSTGIAHTLSGVLRLGLLFENATERYPSESALHQLASQVEEEILAIDELISLAYLLRDDFETWSAACQIYVAAATTCERQWFQVSTNASNAAGTLAESGFLLTGNPDWRQQVRAIYRDAEEVTRADRSAHRERERFLHRVAERLSRYNQVGLFDPKAQNMYRYTSAPQKAGPA